MTRPSPDEIAAALSRHPHGDVPAVPGRRHPRRAGVLVPLYWDPDPVCLATERSAELNAHGGEVSFPGGKPDAGEALRDTALREAREELGFGRIRVLGRLSSMPVYTSAFRLVPWVAEVAPPPHRPNPAEVARLVPLRLREVLALDHIDAVPFDLRGEQVLSPVFETGGKPMFGATAHVFLELLEVLAPLLGLRAPPLRPGPWDWPDLV